MSEGANTPEDEVTLGNLRSEGSDWKFDEIKKGVDKAPKSLVQPPTTITPVIPPIDPEEVADIAQKTGVPYVDVARKRGVPYTREHVEGLGASRVPDLSHDALVNTAIEQGRNPTSKEDVEKDKSGVEGGVNVMGGAGTPTRPEIDRFMFRIERGRFTPFESIDIDAIQQKIDTLTDIGGNPISDQEKYNLTKSVIATETL